MEAVGLLVYRGAVPVFRSSNGSRPDGVEASTHAPGTLRAALSHRSFRWVYSGTAASNVGTWMQNVTLGVLAYQLTGEAWFIGVLLFAQLGPSLLFSAVGGALADRFDRRAIMVWIALSQLVLAFILAVVALAEDPNKIMLVVLVALMGTGNALNGPTANAVLPTLVPREDLRGAVALNSASMNFSRVFGPILGGVVEAIGGASLVFAVNGVTYLFVVVALMSVKADFSPPRSSHNSPWRQVREGFSAVHADRVIERIIFIISVMSLVSLVFIYQMPKLAEEELGLDGWKYNILFASFGLGAGLGALAMGSFLSRLDRARATRWGLVVLAVMLSIFATTSKPAVAFPSVFLLGAAYFVVVTALLTTLQLRTEERVLGRVMGIWMMAWAGLVPVGGLIAGPFIDWFGMEIVLLVGAVTALLLSFVDLRDPSTTAEVVHTLETDEATDLALGETAV